jgi:hypothetical protein
LGGHPCDARTRKALPAVDRLKIAPAPLGVPAENHVPTNYVPTRPPPRVPVNS